MNSPDFDQINGELALRDSEGYRQPLYPAFADQDFVVNTFSLEPGLSGLTLTSLPAGLYQATLGGAVFRIRPGMSLQAAPASQAGQMWWVDAAGPLNIRYPDGLSQGFGIVP